MTVTELGRSSLRRGDDEDVFKALRNLPAALGRVSQPEDTVVLRVRALAMTPATENFLHAFVRVFWLATLRLKSDDDYLLITNTDLTDALDLPPSMAARVGQLVLSEDWMFGGGSGVADGEWSRVINERTRAVMTVRNVDDYIALEGQQFWTAPARVLSEGAVGISLHESLGVIDEPSRDVPALTAEELHPLLRAAAARLLDDRHYDQAVFAGALAMRDALRERSGLHALDGYDLAGAALGGDTPRVAVADLSTTTGQNEQRGLRLMAQGCFLALRNPLAHERNIHQDRISAMEALAVMSLVTRRVTEAGPQLTEPHA